MIKGYEDLNIFFNSEIRDSIEDLVKERDIWGYITIVIHNQEILSKKVDNINKKLDDILDVIK